MVQNNLSFFPFMLYALPSGGKAKDAVSINTHFRLVVFDKYIFLKYLEICHEKSIFCLES